MKKLWEFIKLHKGKIALIAGAIFALAAGMGSYIAHTRATGRYYAVYQNSGRDGES